MPPTFIKKTLLLRYQVPRFQKEYPAKTITDLHHLIKHHIRHALLNDRLLLDLIKNAITANTILLGDFNLDWSKHHSEDYSHKNYFNDMDTKLGANNLIQLFNSKTIKRLTHSK